MGLAEGHVVLKGSTAVKKTYSLLSKGYRARREELIRDGVMAPGRRNSQTAQSAALVVDVTARAVGDTDSQGTSSPEVWKATPHASLVRAPGRPTRPLPSALPSCHPILPDFAGLFFLSLHRRVLRIPWG